MKNIILCGFMGCGKSTIGKILAKKTGTTFVDMDNYIEKKAGMSISEIFEKHGEDHFRDLEHQACIELSQTDNKIIAAGGGALTFDRNITALKENGTILFLDASYKAICIRLKNDTTRPLLQCENRNEKIRELLEKRVPLYRKAADLTVEANLPPNKVTAKIMEIIK